MRRSVESHHTPGMMFHHPVAFFAGCVLVTLGVLAHVPMFMHAAAMGYRMVGMPMDATMLTGMGLIPIGLLLSSYGLMPRLAELQNRPQTQQLFHIEDIARLNSRHWQLVIVLFVAVAVDVMKPATLGQRRAPPRWWPSPVPHWARYCGGGWPMSWGAGRRFCFPH